MQIRAASLVATVLLPAVLLASGCSNPVKPGVGIASLAGDDTGPEISIEPHAAGALVRIRAWRPWACTRPGWIAVSRESTKTILIPHYLIPNPEAECPDMWDSDVLETIVQITDEVDGIIVRARSGYELQFALPD